MAPLLSPQFVAMDVLCCMGIGFLVAFLRALVPETCAVVCFVVDFLAVFIALTLTQAYAVQGSYAGTLRFYMVCGLVIGIVGFEQTLAAHLVFFLQMGRCLLSFPMRLLLHKVLKPSIGVLKEHILAHKQRKCDKKIKKTVQKQLQMQQSLLYNSNI